MSKKNQKLKNFLCYLRKERTLPDDDNVISLIFEYARDFHWVIRCAQIPPQKILIGIVGGGIGGFALAIALQRRGIKSIVFEKDGSFEERKQGFFISNKLQTFTTIQDMV